MKQQYTIVIVDDSAEDRATYRRYLNKEQEYSYNIIECEYAQEIRTFCQQQIPDVILLDYILTDGDGLDLLSELQAQMNSSKLPVVMLTGYGNTELAVQAIQIGAYDYFNKDTITQETLCRSVKLTINKTKLQQDLILRQKQQQLISLIAGKISQFINLEKILDTAVIEGRKLINADRLLVYQFGPGMTGIIVAESVLPEWIPCINRQIEDTCFRENKGKNYREGNISICNNIATANLSDCYRNLLQKFEVQANLVVPILLPHLPNSHSQGNLWGLLVAHQCSQPRCWQESETSLLEEIAGQMALAIQHATLYKNWQNINPEQVKIKQENEHLLQIGKSLEFVSDAIAIGDIAGKPIYLNPSLVKLFGYTLEEFQAAGGPSAVHADQAKLHTIIDTAIRGKSWTGEVSIQKKNGEKIVTLLRTDSIKNDQGKLIGFIAIHTDITERKKSEIALQQINQALQTTVALKTQHLEEAQTRIIQSEELFSTIFQAAPLGIILFRLDNYQIQKTSPLTSEMLGYTERELNTLTTIELTHPEDRAQSYQYYQHLRAGIITKFQQEKRYICKDNQVIWVNVTATSIRFDNNEIYGLGMIKDITEIKNAELRLAESRNFIDRISDANPSIVYIYDIVEQRNIYVNHRIFFYLGYTPEEIQAMGSSFFPTLMHPEDLPLLFEQSEKLKKLSDGEVINMQYRIKDKQESWHWLDDRVTVFLRNNDGTVKQIMGTAQDITHYKIIESALKESEARFRLLAEYSKDMIFRRSPDHQILYISPACRTLLGYEPEEVIGTYSYVYIHPDDHPIISDRNPNQNDDTILTTVRVKHKKGHYIWMESIVRPIYDPQTGEIIEYHTTSRDVTDRKRVEDELKIINEKLSMANVELSRATRLKDEFMANISHELRTPLNAILGMSESLQEEIYGVLNERQKKSISTIERNGQHLLELINDILDLSTIESGETNLKIAPVNISTIADQSMNFIKHQATRKNITLMREVPANLSEIPLDERRIRQILTNLLNNAVKFTPEGGKVSLEIEVKDVNNDHYIIFTVSDTGIGIAPENIDKLFQNFFQLDSRLSRNYEGSGLGLALVHRIVEMHGGSITVDSDLGKGSIFQVKLPYNPDLKYLDISA